MGYKGKQEQSEGSTEELMGSPWDSEAISVLPLPGKRHPVGSSQASSWEVGLLNVEQKLNNSIKENLCSSQDP